MIRERARVVAVAKRSVWVETDRQFSCAACSDNNKGCGAASLTRALGRRRLRLRAINHLPLHVGDEVIIGIDARALLRSSFAVYLAPLLMLFLGAGLGALWFPGGEGISILLGFTGLIAGILWLQSFGHRIRFDKRYQSCVLEQVTARASSGCILSP